MSTAPLTGCGLPIFGILTCNPIVNQVVVPIPPNPSVVDYFILEMLDAADDDIRVQINSMAIVQGSPSPTIFYWDYVLNDWSSNWTSTQTPTAIPGGGQTVFPITNMNRRWNVEWYGGPGWQVGNFIKIKYTGLLNPGDVVSVDTFDGFQSAWTTVLWRATVYFTNGSHQVLTGGTAASGTSPNTPSPPRYNPVSAPPYDTRAHVAAFLGLPDYLSQGYPHSGAFFADYYPNGNFTIPTP